jgi:hypothetical protein
LAASVKVTGLVIGGAFLAAVLVYNKVVCTGRNRFRWTSLIIPGLVALMVIYLLNPYFWPSFGDFRIAVAASEVKSLLTNLRQGNLDAEGIRERYPHLSNVGRLAEFPGQFIRWKRLMKIQAKSTGAGWNKSRLVSIHKQLFLHFSTFPMEWMFFVIGLVYLGRSMCNSLRNKCYSACSIVLVFFFINYALIVFFLELNWDRYYLSTIAASAVVVAFGLVESVTFVSRRLFTLSRFLTRKSD